jgi:hypothetical protein
LSLPELLAQIRQLTERYKAGRVPDSFDAFKDLVSLLFSHTILEQGQGLRLIKGTQRSDSRVLSGWRPLEPLRLNNGRYLFLSMTLFREETDKGTRIKVAGSKFQYQLDKDGDAWVFRYDYARESPNQHPSNHLHIRGKLTENCLAEKQLLEDIHFSTDRVSFESIIRLLIEQFGIVPNSPQEIWRPMLTESERLFKDIAHKFLSGPAR